MECKVTTLYIGQGAMNLIEIYDGVNLVNLSLIDCGGSFIGETNEAIAYVQDKMQRRWNASGWPNGQVYLDNLIITHRDADHINLFAKIFAPCINNQGVFESENSKWFSFHDGIDLNVYKQKINASTCDEITYTQFIHRILEEHFIFAQSIVSVWPDQDKVTHYVKINCSIENEQGENNCSTLGFEWTEKYANFYYYDAQPINNNVYSSYFDSQKN